MADSKIKKWYDKVKKIKIKINPKGLLGSVVKRNAEQKRQLDALKIKPKKGNS